MLLRMCHMSLSCGMQKSVQLVPAVWSQPKTKRMSNPPFTPSPPTPSSWPILHTWFCKRLGCCAVSLGDAVSNLHPGVCVHLLQGWLGLLASALLCTCDLVPPARSSGTAGVSQEGCWHKAP